MKMLLINPIIDKEKYPESFPIGLAYIASVLIQKGHSVQVLDMNASNRSLTAEDIIDTKLKEYEYDVVGITAMLSQYKSVKQLSHYLKSLRPNIPILIGGAMVSASPDYILRNCDVDIGVIGEGEITVPHLVSVLENGGELKDVKGICYKKGDEVIRNAPQIYIHNLDRYPFPAWELFPVDIYLKHGVFGMDDSVKSMDIFSSRGCPYRCTYCFHGLFGYEFRGRSPENILKEMQEMNHRYDISGFVFRDDTFILNRERVINLCKLFSEGNYRFKWSCNGRINLMDNALLNMMRKAGCVMIGYGIESGSQHLLENLNKKQNVAQAVETIRMTWDAGIIPRPYFMVGIPGETRETFKETVNLCKEIGVFNNFFIFTPVPGTELFRKAKDSGLFNEEGDIIENWNSWEKDVLVNMTDIPSKELIEMKEEAEREIYTYIIKNFKKFIWKKFIIYMHQFGIKVTFLRSIRWLKERFKYNINRIHQRET